MTKSIAITFFIILLLLCPPTYTLANLANDYDGEFYFYTYQYKDLANTNIVKNGKAYIINCKTKDSLKTYKNLDKSKISGMSFIFNGSTMQIQKLIKKLKISIKSSENIEKIAFYSGFSPFFKDYTTYNNQKINIQIAYKENKIHIGVPLILGSI